MKILKIILIVLFVLLMCGTVLAEGSKIFPTGVEITPEDNDKVMVADNSNSDNVGDVSFQKVKEYVLKDGVEMSGNLDMKDYDIQNVDNVELESISSNDPQGRIKITLGNEAGNDLYIGQDGNFAVTVEGDTNKATFSNDVAVNGTLDVNELQVGGQPLKTGDVIIIAASDTPNGEARAEYICDGTDDQIEINNAILELPVYGGEIMLLEGNYQLGAAVNMDNSNITLRGVGNGTILTLPNNFDTDVNMLYIPTTAVGLIIENMILDGNEDAQTSGNQQGIYIADSLTGGEIRIENVNVFNLRGTGIRIGADSVILNECAIKNCGVDGTSAAVLFDTATTTSNRNSIFNSIIEDNKADGIVFDSNEFLLISSCHINDNIGVGIRLNADYANINGCFFKLNQTGIVSTARYITINGNNFYNSLGNHLELDGATYNTISANSFVIDNAIELNGADHNIFAGNINFACSINTIGADTVKIGNYSGGNIIHGEMKISNYTDHLFFNETDGPTDEKNWSIKADTGELQVITGNDLWSGGWESAFKITRSGASVEYVLFPQGKTHIGGYAPNELCTVEGVVSLRETSVPSATANYGKIYVKSSDNNLYFKDDSGNEYKLN